MLGAGQLVGGMTTGSTARQAPAAGAGGGRGMSVMPDAPAAAASVKDGARFDDLTDTWVCRAGRRL